MGLEGKSFQGVFPSMVEIPQIPPSEEEEEAEEEERKEWAKDSCSSET